MDRFVRGFVAGVAHAGGTITQVEYLSDEVDGFNDPEKAETVAESLFQDADVIFPVAGASGLGVFAARTVEGRYTFGMDVDQSWLAPGTIVGSVVKHLDDSVLQAVRRGAQGSFISPSGGVTVQAADLVFNALFSEQGQAAIEGAQEAAQAAEGADLEVNPW